MIAGKNISSLKQRRRPLSKLDDHIKDLQDYRRQCLKNGKWYVIEAIDHALELLKAELEGQLVALPCKVGDTVYWASNFGKAIHHGKITALKISGFGIDLEIATPANLLFRCEAETVFLTRDEAEAALKEAEQE